MGVFNILLIVFLSIFIITAVLTLLSIPEWIKIPEWYKKKLFTALILEVVAVVILLGKKVFIDDNVNMQEQVYISIDKTGKLNPYIVNSDGDTTFISGFCEGKDTLELDSHFDKTTGCLYVKDKSGNIFAKVPREKIKGGLYNSISPSHKDHVVTNTEYTSTITFKPNAAKTSWSRKSGSFLDDVYKFEVYVANGGTHYRIYKTEEGTKTVLYDTYDEELYDNNNQLVESKVRVVNQVSSESLESFKKSAAVRKMRPVEARSTDLFKEGSRLLHLVDNGNMYYFFWITNAELDTNPYVEVQQIKVELQLN